MASMAAVLEHLLWVREARTANKMVDPKLKVKESQSSRLLGKGPGQAGENPGYEKKAEGKGMGCHQGLGGCGSLNKNGSYIGMFTHQGVALFEKD